jgi:hypothetical protein
MIVIDLMITELEMIVPQTLYLLLETILVKILEYGNDLLLARIAIELMSTVPPMLLT